MIRISGAKIISDIQGSREELIDSKNNDKLSRPKKIAGVTNSTPHSGVTVCCCSDHLHTALMFMS